jgi:outer membrane immunogenic protein
MRKISVVLAGLLAASSFSAVAADPAGTSSAWNGWYVGVHGGEMTNKKGSFEREASYLGDEDPVNREDITDTGFFFEVPESNRGRNVLRALGIDQAFKDKGALVGITVGKNWRFDNLGEQAMTGVLGVELDLSKANVEGNSSSEGEYSRGIFVGTFRNGLPRTGLGYGYAAPWTTESKSEITALSTLRGRAGFVVSNSTLFYATGGLAAGRVKAQTQFSGSYCSNTNCADLYGYFLGRGGLISSGDGESATAANFTKTESSTRLGWAAGLGMEHMITKNISLKAEYLFYDLGSKNVTNQVVINNPDDSFSEPTTVTKTDRFGFKGNLFRVGLNYQF